MEVRVSKCQRIGIHDIKKKQNLNKYKSKDKKKDVKYVFLPFITLFSFFQKELKHPIDMGKKTRKLNYFVYIPKIG